ncbi:MAG TPA: LamG-like jellyroll fold domain-containing protein [bacterium]
MKKNRKKIQNLFLDTMILLFLLANSLFAQKHSATSAHTSYIGLSMTGYQGWFGAPGDGGTNSFRHYNGSNGFKPGSASIEYWPDMREADEDEKYPTNFVKSDSTSAYVFSSVHPKTVNRHFQWMKEYGIDGAFMQRFRSDFGIKPTMNKILGNALNAAREHGRAVALMYDLSGTSVKVAGVPDSAKRAEEVKRILDDWKELIDTLNLTTGGDDQPYLYHNGKPLVVLWGLGFNSRHGSNGYDVQYFVDMVDSLQNNPQYGGCAIMIGVPTYWRTGGSDCITGAEHTKMLNLLRTVDIIQPWHTSRYSRSQMSTEFRNMVENDIVWCNANGIAYTPTVSPGIREKILQGNNYEKPREGGYYFWDMAKAAIEAGSEMLYLGMFDEVDEGTQYHKIDNNPPFYSNNLSFATYGNDPEDHYLWLAGEATRALRGEFIMGAKFRERANAIDWQSAIEFVDKGDTLEMYISTDAAGRKVYYADPYKVPDGAPTLGIMRDASLFKHELTGSAVQLGVESRGLYIRFVEVDENTDQVLAYKTVAPFIAYGSVPYNTGFEDGILDPRFWAIETENENGRAQITKENSPYNGSYHLILDVSEGGNYSTSAALLHLDISKVIMQLELNFYWKNFGATINETDGVYFSDDKGATFKKVSDLTGGSSNYQLVSLNINELIAAHGLNFTETFIIKFQHRGNASMPDGGFAFDNVNISYRTEKSGFAQFLAYDTETQGDWTASYGFDGHVIVGKKNSLPDYATITWDADSKTLVWQDSSSDVRGLIFDNAQSSDNRILAARYAEEQDHPWIFSLDVGDSSHNVSMYFLDGDNQDRQFIIEVIDASNGDVYDVQTIKSIQNGKWITWRLRGQITFVMKLLQGPNAVVSGIFFDPSSPSKIEVEISLTFDGKDDFVDCGKGESLRISGTEMTLEAWFKINSAKQNTWQSTILAMDHSESGNDVGYFMRANGNGQINWGFGDGKWHEVKSEDGIQLFELDTWNHVAGVYDGSTQKIYLNGNLVASEDSIYTKILPTPSEHLYIGSSPYFFNRVIDASLAEVRVWNIARTNSQIKEFATKRITGSETGLAAYWPMNEGEGQTITDISPNNNNGLLGGTIEETNFDPVWIKSEPIVKMVDILKDYNGSFENGFTFWRFYEVPNALGSTAKIIQGDVVHGANAAKVTYIEPDGTLGDRALDNWDSNMALEPGAEYFAEFWTKADSIGAGKLNVTYGFFDTGRRVISEAGVWFEITKDYQKYKFSFTTPPGTAKGWLAFRWKDQSKDKFLPGVIYFDHIQLWTKDKTVGIEDISTTIPDKFELRQNYPNPFNPYTTIEYSLPEIFQVQLSIYNVLGQKVVELVNQKMKAGTYNVVWKAQNLSGGIYIIALKTNSTILTKKLMLLK